MRLLLDECVPGLLAHDLSGFDVSTVEEAGFKGLKNGALLKAAGERFDVLVTADQGIKHQQNLKTLPLAVLLIHTRTNKLEHLQEFLAEIVEALAVISKHEFKEIEK